MLTWDGRILTLHLNYVAGYTDPLLFLFERTHNYYVDSQGLVPWLLRRLEWVRSVWCGEFSRNLPLRALVVRSTPPNESFMFP